MSNKKVTLNQVFKDIIWPRKNILLVGLLLIIISRAASLVLPYSTGIIIDDIVVNKDMELMKYFLIAVLISITIQAITSFYLTKLLSVEAQNLISKLRVEVLKKILSLPINYFDNNKSFFCQSLLEYNF